MTMDSTPLLIGNNKVIIYEEKEWILIGFGKIKNKVATVEYYNETIVNVINHTNKPIIVNGKKYF